VLPDALGDLFRLVNQGKDVSLGKHFSQSFKNTLAAPIRNQPVMHKGNVEFMYATHHEVDLRFSDWD